MLLKICEVLPRKSGLLISGFPVVTHNDHSHNGRFARKIQICIETKMSNAVKRRILGGRKVEQHTHTHILFGVLPNQGGATCTIQPTHPPRSRRWGGGAGKGRGMIGNHICVVSTPFILVSSTGVSQFFGLLVCCCKGPSTHWRHNG